ncbi:hypothetical protein JTE90_003841 [Oedothorax gibbosus]|uniref:Uncharacterized protein n=1 Tax=Oedothorax gibbosus TaxID=931172 RepID=A0AAV6TK90_9ARAC|nr:hypothetical protein JTE90_003841 [Oedothorax gibbosus]
MDTDSQTLLNSKYSDGKVDIIRLISRRNDVVLKVLSIYLSCVGNDLLVINVLSIYLPCVLIGMIFLL